MSHACKSIPKNIFILHVLFQMYIVTNKSKKCFFISIFILGRSRVKHCTTIFPGLIILLNSIGHDIMIHAIPFPFISTCC